MTRWLLLLASLLLASEAFGQALVLPCYYISPNECQRVSGTTPLPVTVTSTAVAGITPVVGGSAASSQVLKASPGNLYAVYADCTSACWLMVFNSASAPTNGATTAGTASGNLVECLPVTAGQASGLSYGSGPPAAYSVGITAAISSTACATLTLSTVGFIHGMVQ